MDDNISIQRINTLHPKIRKEVLALYRKVNNLELGKGVRLRMSYTTRTIAEQNALYAQGRTTPGKKVTNAKGGQSIHQYHLAFDIVILYDKDGDGNFEEASWDTKRDGDKDGISDWLEVTKVFVAAGYTNGFITNGKKWDLPHFQKSFGHTWQSLQKLQNEGKTFKDDNGITYIKL